MAFICEDERLGSRPVGGLEMRRGKHPGMDGRHECARYISAIGLYAVRRVEAFLIDGCAR